MYVMTLPSVFYKNLQYLALYYGLVLPVFLGASSFSITFVLNNKNDFAVGAFICIGLFTITCKGVAHIAPVPDPLSAE